MNKVIVFKCFVASLCCSLTLLLNAQITKSIAGNHADIKHSEGKMLGADISFLPQLEAAGNRFYDAGKEQDVLAILKSRGFNYIRLRIFNEPANDSGYSPKKGFCDAAHTLQMAMRIKKAGLKMLLDFHYSDTWADPGKQFKPLAWQGMDFNKLNQAVYDFTKTVMQALKDQGTLPDMVQVGNEINHGMIWPDAAIQHLDTLAAFLKSGIAAVRSVNPATLIMLHIACGGQNEESRFFIDNMVKRQVVFDIIGESYYPKWHGSPEDLKHNLTDLAERYEQDIIVVEYSQNKQDVNDIVFNLPGNKGIGTCIWEPLSWGEIFFDKDGKSNALLEIYPLIHKKYGIK